MFKKERFDKENEGAKTRNFWSLKNEIDMSQ